MHNIIVMLSKFATAYVTYICGDCCQHQHQPSPAVQHRYHPTYAAAASCDSIIVTSVAATTPHMLCAMKLMQSSPSWGMYLLLKLAQT